MLTLYEVALAVDLLLIVALIAAMRTLSAPAMPAPWVRILCAVTWAGCDFWLIEGRPMRTWVLGYELTLWLLLCVACVVLWVLPPPVEEPPAEAEPMAMKMHPIKINGRYRSENSTIAQRSRHIRNKYRSQK
jgi:hypothetical protein